MNRYILRYCGAGAKPARDVERPRAHPDLKVVDDSSARMVLVEAPEEALKSVLDSLPQWVMNPEQTICLPEPYPKPVRPPGEDD